jgi:4-amino-4-deoxy-L-arabinose transferase-like glycosyltransferase
MWDGQTRGVKAHRIELAALAVAVTAGLVVLWATRYDPALSPDSISYLSTATHLRSGEWFTDFTGEPMAVFGPLFAVLLAPGGRSLLWARLIESIALAGSALGMFALLRHRVAPHLAVVGAAMFVFSALLIRVAGTVWSEVPYLAIALAALVVSTRPRPSDRWAALAGALAGLGFLTRYAGVGLIATVVAAVALSSAALGWRHMLRRVAVCTSVAVGVGAVWVVRNLVVVGQPLGPRFEGGAGEPLSTTFDLAFAAIGRSIVGDGAADTTARRWGVVVVAGLVAFIVVAVVRLAVRAPHERWRRSLVSDLTVGVFGLTSVLLPVWSRTFSANDIESRVMSPVFVTTVYVVMVVVALVPANPATATLGAVAALVWVGVGWAAAVDLPDRTASSIASRDEVSPALHDAVDELGADAVLLSNSPQRFWWHTDRDPVQLAFTQPRAGNSHYPLDAEATLRAACTGRAALAWFTTLRNAGEGPGERRPDLLEVVDLTLEREVDGGAIYSVTPIDRAACPP